MAFLRAAPLALALALAAAPYQCAREPDPNRRIEDEPAEAVYKLAERFRAENKPEARATTLRYLIERYPTSRFARGARLELTEMGQTPPPEPAEH